MMVGAAERQCDDRTTPVRSIVCGLCGNQLQRSQERLLNRIAQR